MAANLIEISSHAPEEHDPQTPKKPSTHALEEHNTRVLNGHSMGNSLREYVYQRIHQDIKRLGWQTI